MSLDVPGRVEHKIETSVEATQQAPTTVEEKQEETRPAWAPKSGKLWSDEDDEEDEEYKAAYPALG